MKHRLPSLGRYLLLSSLALGPNASAQQPETQEPQPTDNAPRAPTANEAATPPSEQSPASQATASPAVVEVELKGASQPPPAALSAPAPKTMPPPAAAKLFAESLRPIHELKLEYRIQHTTMQPLSVNDLTAADVAYLDQRLRIDSHSKLGDKVHIKLQADVLDGVLFGDNGSFFGSPRRNRGSVVGARDPNLARLSVGQLDPAGASLDPDNYGLVLAPAEPVAINHLYGEVLLPVGLLRIGRQPLARKRTVLLHPGSRTNRWGVSKGHDSTDAIAFATKLSAIRDVLAGRTPDTSMKRGLFWAVVAGQVVENLPYEDDDLFQFATTAFYRAEESKILGLDAEYLDVSGVYAHRRSAQNDTRLHTFSLALELQTSDFRFVFHHAQMKGQTREIGEAMALFGGSAGGPALQPIESFGGFAELAWRTQPLELSFELYYASGDENPSIGSPLTQLTMTPDTNVGLHLFEHVVAYQTARSVERGVVNLRPLDPPGYPITELSSRGGLQNAIVLFPQVLADLGPKLALRAGVMFAYSHVPVVDAIGSLLAADGRSIDDDRRNFNGGKPGTYWGTELDLGLTWKPQPGFFFDLEAAYLRPGDALYDEHGDAVDSFLGVLRFTYLLE